MCNIEHYSTKNLLRIKRQRNLWQNAKSNKVYFDQLHKIHKKWLLIQSLYSQSNEIHIAVGPVKNQTKYRIGPNYFLSRWIAFLVRSLERNESSRYCHDVRPSVRLSVCLFIWNGCALSSYKTRQWRKTDAGAIYSASIVYRPIRT